MAQTRIMSMTVLAMALGGSLLSATTGAQQTYGAPPAYGSPRYQEPSPGGEIQLYSLPTGPAEAPAMPAEAPAMPAETPVMSEPPPRPSPYANPEPTPPAQPQSDLQYPDDAAGPDWSPPGGSIKIEDYQGVRYASGGVGESERAELSALSNQFNLRLLFAMQSSGDYLADIRVRILDSRGRVVLDAESDGPWFYAALPPGTYTVEVGVLDQTQRQTVRIDGSRQTQLNFYWR